MILTDGIIADKKIDKTDYQKFYGRNIDKTSNGCYRIRKMIDGKVVYFGTYDTFNEAVIVRDKLSDNGWDKNILLTYDDLVNRYFEYIHINSKYYYEIRRPVTKNDNVKRYMGVTKTIEETLYYRDIARMNNYIIGKPKDYDLITDNPYIINGLDYPIPEKLQIKKPKTNYGKGYVKKKSYKNFQVWYNKKYYGSYPTYEYAEYIRQKLYENKWDTQKLDEIKKEYPIYYTYIQKFWRYITYDEKTDTWRCDKHISNNNHIIFTFNNPYDVLYERDLYEKYDWNIDLLVELDNTETYENPYKKMDYLPPYPTQKVQYKYTYTKQHYMEFMEEMIFFIKEFEVNTLRGMAETLDTNARYILDVLKKFSISWNGFKELCEYEDDPLTLLTYTENIIKPNLNISNSKTDYIYYDKRRKYSPYFIQKNKTRYGTYSDKKTAKKVVNRLKKCNWDKKQLPDILKEINYQTPIKKGETCKKIYLDKRNPKNIRYYIKYLSTYYGVYDTIQIAEKIVEELEKVDWDKKQLPQIKEKIGV